jgi:hypothetical protein
VLVGADGINSSIRQNLYRQLDAINQATPTTTLAPTGPSITPGHASEEKIGAGRGSSFMGITQPMDKERYPELNQAYSDYVIMMSQKGKETVSDRDEYSSRKKRGSFCQGRCD